MPGALKLVVGNRDGTARIWNTEFAKTHVLFDSPVKTIAVARGAVAAGLEDSGIVIIGDQAKLELHGVLGHLGSVRALAFTPDGKQLVSGGDDAAAIVWDAVTGAQRGVLARDTQPLPSPIEAIAIDPGGDHVALLREGKIQVWSLASSKLAFTLQAAGPLKALAISPTTGAIAAVGDEGMLAVWDARGNLVRTTRGLDVPYTAVAYSPAGDAIVAAGPGIGHVWQLFGDMPVFVPVTLEGGMGVVNAALVTADVVLTAGDNGRALVWDRRTGKLIGTRDRHDKAISSLALAGNTLWIASEDQTLNSWDVSIDTQPAAELRKFMADTHVPVELRDDVVRKRTR